MLPHQRREGYDSNTSRWSDAVRRVRGAARLIIVVYMFALLLLRFVMRYKSTSLWFLHTAGVVGGGAGCTQRKDAERKTDESRCLRHLVVLETSTTYCSKRLRRLKHCVGNNSACSGGSTVLFRFPVPFHFTSVYALCDA